jgi:tripartite-type tricarboxylate transporter receptor subunit TctC
MVYKRRAASIAIVLLALGFRLTQPSASETGVSFAGKTISILIGGGVGGGADVYARLLANFYGGFLPGSPRFISRNMTGSGGLELANHIFNVSPKDGTEIGTFLTSTALEPLFGDKDAKFRTKEFSWIGNMLDSDATACISGKPSGIKSWQDLKGRTTSFGASGPSSLTSVQTKTVSELLGVKTKVVEGYQGTRTSTLALESGELDALCGLYISTLVTQFKHDIADGNVSVWMTFGKTRSDAFPDVPTIFELIKSPADRALADLIFGQEELGRPFSAPPGLAPAVTDVLRTAFMRTMKDGAFLAAAKTEGLSIHPVDGAETQRQYAAFFDYPSAIVERAKLLMTGG